VSKVRVALAQMNATVGDLAGNARRIVDAARQAHAQGAVVMIAPELALSGYPPEDLLLRPAFMDACARQLETLARELTPLAGLTVVVGHPMDVQGNGATRSRSIAMPERPPTASVNCPTTRSSMSAATSSAGVMPECLRLCSKPVARGSAY
jgi:NAD+ synthase (glutamine-hydrolysing)